MGRSLKIIFLGTVVLFSHFKICLCNENNKPSNPVSYPYTLEQILMHIEKKYAHTSFSVNFEQESTLKAMQITDTASGKAFFKYPNMMRWEYEKPNKQLMITDGISLWIFKPEENQVTIGKSPSFFGEGKGASFLTDIASIRKKFDVSILKFDDEQNIIMKLVPHKTDLDLSYILLAVSKETFFITQISTYNSYEDETKIIFKETKFSQEPDDSLFTFKVPKHADILSYDE